MGDLNSLTRTHTHTHTLSVFPNSPPSSDLAGNEIAAAGTGVGKRDISKISAPRQAWRSRYILTETCIWIEHFAIHGACLLAPGTQDLGLGTWDLRIVSHCHPSRPFCVVASIRHSMVSVGLLVLGHLSLPPLCLTKGPRMVLVSTLVVRSVQGPQGHLGRLVTECCDRKSNLPGLSPHVSRFLFLCVQSNQAIDCCIHRSLHRHIRIMPARKIECAL